MLRFELEITFKNLQYADIARHRNAVFFVGARDRY